MIPAAAARTSAPLHTLGTQALAAGYGAGHFTPSQVWDSLQQAIGNDPYHAFVVVDAQGAAAQAQAATRRWQQGKPLSRLDGVPVSIKDLVMQQGLPTTRGSLLASPAPAADDAPVVRHLRAAGAVLVGKTTTTEMGTSIDGDSRAHGRTLHPQFPAHSVGGSSCGAAAQLAAGWGPLAIGSDAGGSVRIPASYTGGVALKPTFGLLPMWPASPFVEFAHLGPMARQVADLKAVLPCIGLPDMRDPASLFARAASGACVPAAPLRVGIVAPGSVQWLQPEIAQALQALPQQLQGLRVGGQPVQLQVLAQALPDTGDAMWTVWCSRVLEACMDLPAADAALLGVAMQQQWHQGAHQTVQALAQARQQLRVAAGQLAQWWQDIDILLTPTTPSTAPLAGDFVVDAHPHAVRLRASGNWMAATPFSHPFNLTQQPALSLPWGRDAQGLPFGLQVVGARYSDALVLEVGHALESWFKEHTW